MLDTVIRIENQGEHSNSIVYIMLNTVIRIGNRVKDGN